MSKSGHSFESAHFLLGGEHCKIRIAARHNGRFRFDTDFIDKQP